VILALYQALPDVYEWLMPDAKLTPEGSVAAVDDLVRSLPSGARVLDCSCGTGQLAVGLGRLGFDVVATDASPGWSGGRGSSPISTALRCAR
jgi:predicted RNA methylase